MNNCHEVERFENLMYKGCEPHWHCIHCDDYWPFHCYGKKDLEQMECPARTDWKWISVKDRLPEKSGQYLCWFGANKVAIGPAIVTYVDEWKAFGRLESLEKYPNITHWMPLPESPKEET